MTSASPRLSGNGARFVLALLLILVSACSSSPRVDTSDEAWEVLASKRKAFEGARSYMRVRVTSARGRWRFNARVLVDGEGRMVMTGLSPMGTAVFTLNLEHDRVVLQDHHEKTVWEGVPEDLPGILGIQGSFSTRLLPFLLLALPPEAVDGRIVERMGDFIRVESGHAWMVVGRPGPIETLVVERGITIRATYSLPSMPPESVTIRTESDVDQIVELTHLALTFEKTTVPPVEIDASYRGVAVSP